MSFKGKHHTEESKIKISKGNKDKIVLKETRKKISKGNKDKIVSKETRKKMSIRKLGRKISEESKLKQSISKLGKNNPMFGKNGNDNPFYGRHHTEESKQKIKNNQPDQSNENNSFFGKKHTNISKERISRNHNNVSGKNNPMFGKLPSHLSSHGKGSYYDSPLQDKVYLRSSYEIVYAKYLDSKNILWMYEIEIFDLGNTTYTPDFFLPAIEQFIEIKGYMTDKAQDKINKFLEQYPWDLEILRKEDLIKLGCKL